MTLVEAVAGTVVLGTVLVSILMARVRVEKQSAAAGDRLEACGALQSLLETWASDADGIPIDHDGPVPAHPGWRWSTRRFQRDDALKLHADVLGVAIATSDNPQASPVAVIELLLPRHDEEEETPTSQPRRNAH